MPQKFHLRIFIVQLAADIRLCFPYVFGFYLFAFFLSLFSETKKDWFHWPLFHSFMVILTIIYGLCFIWPSLITTIRQIKIKENLKKNLSNLKHLLSPIKTHHQQYLQKTKIKLNSISKSTKIKIVKVITIVILPLILPLSLLNTLILAFGLSAIFFRLDSRWTAIPAVIILTVCPFIISFRSNQATSLDTQIETYAVIAFALITISTITKIQQLIKIK